jgi:predicted nuclease of predicted toxin-antitoxin system
MRFLVDEHIPLAVVRQLQRRYPQQVDVVRVVDVGFKGAADPAVLAWAAEQNRILITQDKATITHFAYERVAQGLAMPGVITLTHQLAIGSLVQELALIVECGVPEDLRGVVYFIP